MRFLFLDVTMREWRKETKMPSLVASEFLWVVSN